MVVVFWRVRLTPVLVSIPSRQPQVVERRERLENTGPQSGEGIDCNTRLPGPFTS